MLDSIPMFPLQSSVKCMVLLTVETHAKILFFFSSNFVMTFWFSPFFMGLLHYWLRSFPRLKLRLVFEIPHRPDPRIARHVSASATAAIIVPLLLG